MKETEPTPEERDLIMSAQHPEIIIPAGSFALQPLEFTEEQKTLIKRMCQAEGLDDNEFQVFLHICQRRRLDPILRQIYATKRNKKFKEGNVEKWIKILVPIVAIEGMTATAERSKTYAPSSKAPEYTWEANGLPKSCTVWMKKFAQGEWHEFSFTAFYKEFCQDTDLWKKMPAHMLMKCARAGALRMGWPEDCGGLYIEEEWSPEPSGELIEAPKRKERERGSIAKMKESKEENRGHGNEGMVEEKKPAKPVDQYKTAVKNATLKSNATGKEWIELKVEGGTANVWNDSIPGGFVGYKAEKIPLTTMYCWHKSLFEVLLTKPQKIVLSVSNKEGSRFSPIVEDVLAVDDKKYEKGQPYVAPEVAVMPKPESEKIVSTPEPKAIRTESVLRLSNAFEDIWPASKLELRALRNKVGQTMLNLQSKEQLNDLTYPQDKIDAAISALLRYQKLQPKPSTETGIINELDTYFKNELEQIQAKQADLDF